MQAACSGTARSISIRGRSAALAPQPTTWHPAEMARRSDSLRRAEGYTATHFPRTSRLARIALSTEDDPKPLIGKAFGVDFTLLRSWLGLVPGPWPPDHYTLLGLAPGPTNSASIEQVVLARMDSLRPHQLLHPDLVTEGMNRLAQALICLTDSAARAAYDAEQAFASKPAPAAGSTEAPKPLVSPEPDPAPLPLLFDEPAMPEPAPPDTA